MALSATTVWEVRVAGSDNNGGGFVSGGGGTDRSQQNAAFASGTNLTVDAVTNTDVAPDGYAPGAADVGNIIQITAGAGFTTGFYQISSIQADKWRLDRSPAATGTAGGAWAMGGALGSPGKAAEGKMAHSTTGTVYIGGGTYTISTTTANVSGGRINDTVNGNGIIWEGYQNARGDLGTAPILQVAAAGVSSITVFTAANSGTSGKCIWRNIHVDGQNNASIVGFSFGARGRARFLMVLNCTGLGISGGATQLFKCRATGCSNGVSAIQGLCCIGCEAYLNTTTGFTATSVGSVFAFCISRGNSGAASDGFQLGQSSCSMTNCASYGNGRAGVFIASVVTAQLTNVLCEANAAYAFSGDTATAGVGLENCGGYNNTSGNINTSVLTDPATNFITGTASFFVNPAAGNMSLNNTAGGGAAARAAGFPGTYPSGLTTGYLDSGGAQHIDAGGGGGGAVIGSGVILATRFAA